MQHVDYIKLIKDTLEGLPVLKEITKEVNYADVFDVKEEGVSEKAFLDILDNGVILCKLIQKLPNAVIKDKDIKTKIKLFMTVEM